MDEKPNKERSEVSRLTDLYQDGRITRRQFVRNVALLGMTLAGANHLLSACAPDTPAEEATPQPATKEAVVAATDTPTPSKSGGVFRIAGDSDIRSLDPPAAEYSEDWWSAGCILYNQLYFFDTAGRDISRPGKRDAHN